jgi:sulfatase modifying factor 1
MVAGLAFGALALGIARGGVNYPETVVVGNPGNPADVTSFGSVPYSYRIGKFEITNAEYCEFLNSTGETSKHHFWRWQMEDKPSGGIIRTGEPGDYVYSIKKGMAKKPAVLMNWYEALRFCNWLSNGKGDCSVASGPYSFTNKWGSMTISMPFHAALADGQKVQWVLASENEWYKAAYYDPKKPGGAGYWKYPAPGDAPPKANLGTEKLDYVGSCKASASPYGTFDQGGSVWEWNEARQSGNCGVRGGSFWYGDHAHYMHSSARYVSDPPEFIYDNYGFRVVALGTAPPAPTQACKPTTDELAAKPEPPFEPKPGVIHVEAEAFAEKSEKAAVYNCDTGGKQVNFDKDVESSWVEYVVDVPKKGTYRMEVMLATANRDQVLHVSGSKGPLGSIQIPDTLGLWKKMEPLEMKLKKGRQTITITAPFQRAVAVRWFELTRKE